MSLNSQANRAAAARAAATAANAINSGVTIKEATTEPMNAYETNSPAAFSNNKGTKVYSTINSNSTIRGSSNNNKPDVYVKRLGERWAIRENVNPERLTKDFKAAADCFYDSLKYDNISKALKELACDHDPVQLVRSLILFPKHVEEIKQHTKTLSAIAKEHGEQHAKTLSAIAKEVESIKELKAAEFAKANDGQVPEAVETKITTHQKAQLTLMALLLVAVIVFGIVFVVGKK